MVFGQQWTKDQQKIIGSLGYIGIIWLNRARCKMLKGIENDVRW